MNLRTELAAELLASAGRMRTTGVGCSMVPVILPGDTLEVRRIAFDDARVGEIALVACGECVFAHRIVREEFQSGRRKLITRGDAMRFEDSKPVSEKEFLGYVESIIRSGRRMGPEMKKSVFAASVRNVLQRSPRTKAAVVRLYSLRERFVRVLVNGGMWVLSGDGID